MIKYFVILLLASTSVFASLSDENSTRIYNIDQQKVFNIAKKILRKTEGGKFVIETYWHSMHASQREVVVDAFSVKIEEVFFQIDVNQTNEGSVFSLAIYSQIEDGEKKKIPTSNILYELFWNRVEYALGLGSWKSCVEYKMGVGRFFEGIYNINNFLCRLEPKDLDVQAQ